MEIITSPSAVIKGAAVVAVDEQEGPITPTVFPLANAASATTGPASAEQASSIPSPTSTVKLPWIKP